jgi:ATPase subunit of ABC transporter with duplicated ATPase domains
MALSKAPKNTYPPAVDIRGLTYELPDGRVLFRDLNASIGPGLTALVGPNGVGKTTLARLISGDLEPTSGHIVRNVPATVFAQREDPDLLHKHLSGGQWMRVRLERFRTRLKRELADSMTGSFLILDEPTNDLDRDGRDAVLDFLRQRSRSGAATLLISHDRETLGLCDQTLELSSQGLALYGGGWREYDRARTHERENLARALETAEKERDRARAVRQAEREKQEKRNRNGAAAAAKGGQAKILLGLRKRNAQATTGKIDSGTLDRAEQAAARLSEALRAQKTAPVLYAAFAGRAIPAQKLLAEAIGFNVRYSELSTNQNGKTVGTTDTRWVFNRDLDFVWKGNVRIALQGSNGSGKSTLVNALLGFLPQTAITRGELRTGNNRNSQILYLDQRCSLLDEDRTVFENVRAVSNATDTEIRNTLAGFLFTRDTVFQPVRTLSGGERLRAALARGFFATTLPEVLVLDEPTNNLDLANIAFLEKVVAGFEGAVIVISHDPEFVRNCGVENVFQVG